MAKGKETYVGLGFDEKGGYTLGVRPPLSSGELSCLEKRGLVRADQVVQVAVQPAFSLSHIEPLPTDPRAALESAQVRAENLGDALRHLGRPRPVKVDINPVQVNPEDPYPWRVKDRY